MAFKTFYLVLWMLFILFATVKGSCLEYGHSCWGAHGKRSGNNKIYPAVIRTPTEIDFQNSNGLNEKNTYDSTEEQANGSADSLPFARDMAKDNGDVGETPAKNSMNFKRFLYKKLNNSSRKQLNFDIPEHDVKTTNRLSMVSDRWQRLPLFKLRRVQITSPDYSWLKDLEQEQQINDDDYI